MEDLSRYFNYSMDTYYRNRDIYLIYERFKVGEELYFDDIAHCLKKWYIHTLEMILSVSTISFIITF